MIGLKLRTLRAGDERLLASVDGGNGWNSDPALWAIYLRENSAGTRLVVLALLGQRPIGYGTLLWQSGYEVFIHADIPEINNLAVDAKMRRQGVATAMIHHFEGCASRAGKSAIGIGVGLYADYGPAQRLYVNLGFRPDGRGVTYENRTVRPGSKVRVDDQLVMWLTKRL